MIFKDKKFRRLFKDFKRFDKYIMKSEVLWANHRVHLNKDKVSQQERDRFHELYINWNMQETNRKLVRATWFLAIATSILSLIALYLQYGVKHS